MNNKTLIFIMSFGFLMFQFQVSNAQTEFQFWQEMQGLDDGQKTDGVESLPQMDIPSATTNKSDEKKDLLKNLEVNAPKDIPLINVPSPPSIVGSEAADVEGNLDAEKDQAAEVSTIIKQDVQDSSSKIESNKILKTRKVKSKTTKSKNSKKNAPVVFKKEQNDKLVVPKRKLPSDKYLSTTLSTILKQDSDLETNFSPSGNDVRRKYDYKTSLPKFLQKDKFNEKNKHIPKVVYQKQYSELLFAAIQKDDVGALNALIYNGADINSKFVENGYTALMYALQTSKIRSFRYLMTKGADINIQGNDGKSVLHLAAEANNVEVFIMLLENGVNPFISDYVGKTALDYVEPSIKSQFEILVARNSIIDDKSLFKFIELGSVKGVLAMLDSDAEINIRNSEGDTPLMVATRNNNYDLVNLLLSRGASTLPINKKGEHVLAIAQKSGYIELASIIETVNIKRELESGIKSKSNLPNKTIVAKIKKPIIDTIAEVQKAASDKKEEMNGTTIKDLAKKTTEAELAKDESKGGFFSAISSIFNRDNSTVDKIVMDPKLDVVEEKLEALVTSKGVAKQEALEKPIESQIIKTESKDIMTIKNNNLPKGIVRKRVLETSVKTIDKAVDEISTVVDVEEKPMFGSMSIPQ